MSAFGIVVSAAWVVIGFAVLYSMAGSRGRHRIRWGVFEAVTSLIALVAILIAGPAKSPQPVSALWGLPYGLLRQRITDGGGHLPGCASGLGGADSMAHTRPAGVV